MGRMTGGRTSRKRFFITVKWLRIFVILQPMSAGILLHFIVFYIIRFKFNSGMLTNIIEEHQLGIRGGVE